MAISLDDSFSKFNNLVSSNKTSSGDIILPKSFTKAGFEGKSGIWL
jgi:hypothetical protein